MPTARRRRPAWRCRGLHHRAAQRPWCGPGRTPVRGLDRYAQPTSSRLGRREDLYQQRFGTVDVTFVDETPSGAFRAAFASATALSRCPARYGPPGRAARQVEFDSTPGLGTRPGSGGGVLRRAAMRSSAVAASRRHLRGRLSREAGGQTHVDDGLGHLPVRTRLHPVPAGRCVPHLHVHLHPWQSAGTSPRSSSAASLAPCWAGHRCSRRGLLQIGDYSLLWASVVAWMGIGVAIVIAGLTTREPEPPGGAAGSGPGAAESVRARVPQRGDLGRVVGGSRRLDRIG